MLDCAEFLDSYSDYRDGRLAAEREHELEAHINVCESCARYDRVIGGGVKVFRSLPPLTPSPDFQTRLLGHLYALESASGRHGSGASMAVTLMICAAIGIGAWTPTLRAGAADPVTLPPIVAHAPYHDLTPVLMQPGVPPLEVVTLPRAPQPRYFARDLLLHEAFAPTMLAYRPVSFYGRR